MKNILYITDLNEIIEISYGDRKEVHNKRFEKFISELCIMYLSTLQGRKEAIKKVFGYRYNVPIFVCEKMLFIKLDKRIWINIYEIKEVIKKEKDLVLILSNNEIITILKGYNKNIRKINDTKKVFSYIEKI